MENEDSGRLVIVASAECAQTQTTATRNRAKPHAVFVFKSNNVP